MKRLIPIAVLFAILLPTVLWFSRQSTSIPPVALRPRAECMGCKVVQLYFCYCKEDGELMQAAIDLPSTRGVGVHGTALIMGTVQPPANVEWEGK
jgi:hypothetical protein